VDSSLPFTLTDCAASYCAAQTVINKKEMEGNYIPPMPGLKRGEN